MQSIDIQWLLTRVKPIRTLVKHSENIHTVNGKKMLHISVTREFSNLALGAKVSARLFRECARKRKAALAEKEVVDPTDGMLTTRELAQITGRYQGTIARLCRDGIIPSVRGTAPTKNGNTVVAWYARPKDVEAWFALSLKERERLGRIRNRE